MNINNPQELSAFPEQSVSEGLNDPALISVARDYPLGKTRPVALGTLQLLAGRGLYFALGYLATIILARGLGPLDYGIYGLIISVLLWVEQTCRFAFPSAAAILISREGKQTQALEQTAAFLNFSLFFFLFVLFWFAAPLLANLFHLPERTSLLRLAFMDLPFFGLYVVYRGVLQGHHDFRSIGIADALYSLAKLVGVLSLVILWLSLEGALIVNILASAGALLFLLSRISLKRLLPVYDFVGPVVRQALPLGLYMLALQGLAYLDLWCLKVLTPDQDTTTLGLYVAARNIAFVPSFVLMAVSEVILPALSRAHGKSDAALSRKYVQEASRFLWLLILPVTILFTVTARNLMTLLYSSTYGDGSPYLSLLVWAALFAAYTALFASMLNARGESLLSGMILIGLIPIALLLNILLVPAYGAMGAAYANVLTSFAGAVVFGLFVYRRFGPPMRVQTFAKAAAAVILMAVLGSKIPLSHVLLGPAYAAYLALYGLILFLLGELSRQDLALVAFWRNRSQ